MATTEMPLRSPTRLICTAMLAMLLVLPGCLTAALWRDYSWPDPKTSTVLVDSSEFDVVGELHASPPTGSNGLRWSGPTGVGST